MVKAKDVGNKDTIPFVLGRFFTFRTFKPSLVSSICRGNQNLGSVSNEWPARRSPEGDYCNGLNCTLARALSRGFWRILGQRNSEALQLWRQILILKVADNVRAYGCRTKQCCNRKTMNLCEDCFNSCGIQDQEIEQRNIEITWVFAGIARCHLN